MTTAVAETIPGHSIDAYLDLVGCVGNLLKHDGTGESMSYAKKDCDELLEAAKPLMRWIAKQGNPNIQVIVKIDSVQAVEGIIYVPTEEFIGDDEG